MGATNTFHRPLVSGIRIESVKEVDNSPQVIALGTLTGLATRNSDGKKALVTNLHVMAGTRVIGGQIERRVYQDPAGDEEMYQESLGVNKKVGSLLAWVPIVDGQDNLADVAMCELGEGVEAEFALHDHPNHSSRAIIEDVVEPVDDSRNPMNLTMLGASGGEGTVTVKRVKTRVVANGRTFTGVTILDCSQRPVLGGDSGAACLYKVKDGQYQMSCILFGGRLYGHQGLAFPASVAQDKLGITFGKRAPTADAGADQSTTAGATVTLDGSGSSDPEGDSLTYRWEQTPSVGGGQVEITNADEAVATFTMPSGPAALTFKLTVTDSLGQIATDVATVIANRPPTGNAGSDQTVDTGVSVNLKGSGADPDRADALTYSWKQILGPRVSLGGKTSATAWFTAPDTPTTLTFRLRVSDGDASDTDTVTVRVIQTTAEQAVNKYDANGDGVIEGSEVLNAVRDYFAGRCSSLEVTAVVARYHADSSSDDDPGSGSGSDPDPEPEPETWGSWTDTGRVRVRTGPAPNYDRIYQKEQERTSNYDNRQTRWVETGRN